MEHLETRKRIQELMKKRHLQYQLKSKVLDETSKISDKTVVPIVKSPNCSLSAFPISNLNTDNKNALSVSSNDLIETPHTAVSNSLSTLPFISSTLSSKSNESSLLSARSSLSTINASFNYSDSGSICAFVSQSPIESDTSISVLSEDPLELDDSVKIY